MKLMGEKLEFFHSQVEVLSKNKEQMKDQFLSISHQVLSQTQENFLQLAKMQMENFQEKSTALFDKKSDNVTQVLTPVKETLEKVEEKIQSLEQTRLSAYSLLKEQVDQLIVTQKELRTETGKLGKALKSSSTRGRWGEIQLKRVVELAGMMNHCDFFEQVVNESQMRPDLIVKLPGGKNIIVDAKTPLEAYLDAQECSEEQKEEKLKEHAAMVRSHIHNLSKKSYFEHFQPTPEFVILFLPAEAFFSAALQHDPSLIECAAKRQIILATPTTLIAVLRAVAYSWRQESLSEHTKQIAQLGEQLCKRVQDVTVHLQKLGRSLSGSVATFNKTVGSFESRVFPTLRKLKAIGEREGEELVLQQIEEIPRLHSDWEESEQSEEKQ